MWLAFADPAAPPPDPALGGSLAALGQTALALLVTCLLAILVLRLLRPAAPRDGGQALQLIAKLRLGEAQALYLVRAAGRYLLLGGTPGGLSSLGEVPPEEVQRILAAEAAQAPSPGLAQRALAALRGRP